MVWSAGSNLHAGTKIRVPFEFEVPVLGVSTVSSELIIGCGAIDELVLTNSIQFERTKQRPFLEQIVDRVRLATTQPRQTQVSVICLSSSGLTLDCASCRHLEVQRRRDLSLRSIC